MKQIRGYFHFFRFDRVAVGCVLSVVKHQAVGDVELVGCIAFAQDFEDVFGKDLKALTHLEIETRAYSETSQDISIQWANM